MSNSLKHSDFNLLIIDDEKDLAETIGDEAELEGYNVDIALDGDSAIKILQSKRIDLILSDVRMPNIDGYELLLQLKDNFDKLPLIVFMSGFSDYSDKKLLVEGATRVFKKPLKEDLFKFIEEALFVPKSA